MQSTRETQREVSDAGHQATRRISTPELSFEQRQRIGRYRQLLKEEGTLLSISAAVLHAAMQTIDSKLKGAA